MSTLVDVISGFDLTVLQEVRDASGSSQTDLLTALNVRAGGEDPAFGMVPICHRMSTDYCFWSFRMFFLPDIQLNQI